MQRIPDLKTVAGIDRNRWESLCATLVTLLFGAHRVEDRRGRGNGLDAWLRRSDGVYGWQFRRLEDRFGNAQAAKVRENITTAATWSRSELQAPLSRFVLVLNIDLEPRHGGDSGEIVRLESLAKWSISTLGIHFSWRGVTWVRSHLLEHPGACPDLFEDLGSAVAGAEARLSARLDALGAQFDNLVQQSRSDAILAVLLREARVHFQRGNDFQQQEELNKSVVSLCDALRLIDDHATQHPKGPDLRANILALLCGIECAMGRLSDALRHGQLAIDATRLMADASLRLFSIGNFAAALSRSSRFDEARPLFEQVLSAFEDIGDTIEVIRTRTYLMEVYTGQPDHDALVEAIGELGGILKAFHSTHEPRPVTLSALGQCANAMLSLSPHDHRSIRQALSILQAVAGFAAGSHLFVTLSARAQQAQCHWWLDELEDACRLYSGVQTEAAAEYPGLAADSAYNHALVLAEVGNVNRAIELMGQVPAMYDALENPSAAADARAQVARLSQKKGA